MVLGSISFNQFKATWCSRSRQNLPSLLYDKGKVIMFEPRAVLHTIQAKECRHRLTTQLVDAVEMNIGCYHLTPYAILILTPRKQLTSDIDQQCRWQVWR